MMYPTVEVRWFYRGAIPDEVRHWLSQSNGKPLQEAVRVDTYFSLPDCDDLGIKLRQEHLEIKQRSLQLGEVTFSNRSCGYVEVWRKWSFSLVESGDEPVTLNQPAGAWIEVKKIRLIYRFKLGDESRLFPLAAHEYSGPGCEVEASNIWIKDHQWWSLAFEAFGPEPVLKETLLTTAKTLLSHDEAPILAARASYGYPGWLVKTTGELS